MLDLTRTPDKTYRHMIYKVIASNLKDPADMSRVLTMLSGNPEGLRSMLRKPSGNRTGTKAWSLFGHQAVFDIKDGFPLLQSKKLHIRSIVGELLWMLSGSTNVKVLQDQGIRIWDEWAGQDGELGPVYGRQWRAWPIGDGPTAYRVDQLLELVDNLRTRPEDRGHIVSAWNVGQLDEMNLRPCHCFFQCHVDNGYLDLQLYQRSADLFLGVPFNIASYALLMCMLARQTHLTPRRFIHTFGNLHIYENHIDQVAEQVSRVPKLGTEREALS